MGAIYYLSVVTVPEAIEQLRNNPEEKDFVAEIDESKASTEDGRIPAKVLARLMRKVLNSPEKRNKGWCVYFLLHLL
jgi:hypothetical protein